MIGKGQMRGVEKGDITGQVAFIANLFGVPPKLNKSGASRPSCSPVRFCNIDVVIDCKVRPQKSLEKALIR
jgi:hypothetical protein